MTRDEIAAALMAAEATATALRRLLAEMDGPSAPCAPAADRELETWQAERLTNRSSSSLYRYARRHGVGWKTEAGSWRFSERALRALFAERRCAGELGENGEGASLPMAMRTGDDLASK